MKQRLLINGKGRSPLKSVLGAALLLLMFCTPAAAQSYAGEDVDAAKSVSRSADVIVSAKISGLSDVQESFRYADGRTETADYLKVTATVSKIWKGDPASVDTALTFFVLKGETIVIPLAGGTAQNVTVDGVDSTPGYQAIKDKGAEAIFFLKFKYLPDDKTMLVAEDFAVQAASDNQYDGGPVSGNQNHFIFEKALLTTFFDFSNEQRDTPPAWLQGRMEVLNALGVVQGYDDGLLRPNNDISREEFVTLLCRVFSCADDTAVCSFGDVSAGDWFYPYVAAAEKAGIVTGVGNNHFGAGQKISRQDAFAMIARAMVRYEAKTLPDGAATASALANFSDAANVASYAQSPVALLYAEGILKGYGGSGGTTVKPTQQITRAEVCQLLYLVKFW